MVLCIQLCIVSWRCAKLQRVCHARIAAVPACLLPRKSVQLERGLHDHDVWVVLSSFMPLPLHFNGSCFAVALYVCASADGAQLISWACSRASREGLYCIQFQVNVLFLASVLVMVHVYSADGAKQMSWTCCTALHQATCQCAVYIQ